MELTAEDYYRLAKIYPFEKERGYGDIKPLWSAILECRRAGFTLSETAIVLETDLDTILFEWDRIQQNAQ